MSIGFGIDFGTTNSVVSRYDANSARLESYLDKSNLPHPSVLWYSDVVRAGREAKNNINAYAQTSGNVFVRSIKAKLGSGRPEMVFGKPKEPFEIAADLFRYLKNDVARDLGPMVSEAVFTVPVNFEGKHRADIRKAAQLAGIHVRTFVHEPLAAIIGYLYGKQRHSVTHDLQNRVVLVFDWGGGTLDITLVKVNSSGLVQEAVGGIRGMAGDYFDEALQQLLINKFLDRNGLATDTLHITLRNRDLLAVEAETAKIRLSSAESVKVLVEEFAQIDGKTYDLHETIERHEFENLILDHVNRAIAEIDRVLQIARIPSEQVALVLLSGGTCKIPLVKDKLSDRFGSRIVDMANSNTVIAEGAAIAAAKNLKPHLAKSVQIELSDGSYYTLFAAETVLLPALLEKEVQFLCTDNRQGEARLIVLETDEQEARETGLILGIPLKSSVPTKYQERVVAHFTMNRDLVLEVEAWGTIKQAAVKGALSRLCFGLHLDEWAQ